MISVILPSMNRMELLGQAVDSLFITTLGHDIELIIIIDEDMDSYELATTHLRDKWNQQAKSFTVLFNKIRRGALSAWNEGLALSTGDILFPYGDDSLCHAGWLDYALETHRDKLDNYGCVGLNDGAYDGNKQVMTTLLFDRQFCKNEFGGVIAIPSYHYYCVDLELNERAKRVNKLIWDDRATVEHIHSAHGKRPIDSTDQYKMDSGWMEADNILFELRKEQGFPNDFKSVI
jgi:glycosyltransferase involved in cell wall biosynthesis